VDSKQILHLILNNKNKNFCGNAKPQESYNSLRRRKEKTQAQREKWTQIDIK
jgi:hypothetical protein